MLSTTRTRRLLLINKMASSRLAQASNQEGKILLAIQAYKRGQVSSIEKASALYTVPHSTLHDRLKGRTTRENA
jgi:predicted HTH domain antitoxin